MANIVVTGSSRGLGLEFVRQLAKFNKTPNVFALCRNPQNAEKLNSLAKENSNITVIKAGSIGCLDMTDFESYKNVAAELREHIQDGGIHLLINNAGMMLKDTVASVKCKNVMDHFQLNAAAPLLFTKELLPFLKKPESQILPLSAGGRSVVVNISAQIGSVGENTTGGYLSYRISKCALNMATKCLSVELKSQGVFVLALHPGWVSTDMGGPGAPLTPQASVNGMLTSLARADDSQRGCLLNHKGHPIPW